jgi:hypothetical protein
MIGYTHNMRVYFGKDAQTGTEKMTAKYTTVGHCTRRVEGDEHKLFMDVFSFFIG